MVGWLVACVVCLFIYKTMSPPKKPSKILPRHTKDVEPPSTYSTPPLATKAQKTSSYLDYLPPVPSTSKTATKNKNRSQIVSEKNSKWTERTSQWWAGASFDCSPSPSVLPIPSEEMLQLVVASKTTTPALPTKNTISPKDLLAQFDKINIKPNTEIATPTKHLKDILHIK